MERWGEIAAFITALSWSVGTVQFEIASRKIGSHKVNLIKMVTAFVVLSLVNWAINGALVPSSLSPEAWFYLTVSGLIGFFIGDLCLFYAFTIIGSRISWVIMSFAPPLTALIGFLLLGETLTWLQALGIALTMGGIVLVIFRKEEKKVKMNHPVKGILLALGGMVGQSVGMVFSKKGLIGSDPFSATQIRVFAGMVAFILFFSFSRRWRGMAEALKDRPAVKRALVGSFFGPIFGVTLSLYALTLTSSGIVSTLTSLVPVILIVPAIFIHKEKVHAREIVGTLVAFAGVTLLFL